MLSSARCVVLPFPGSPRHNPALPRSSTYGGGGEGATAVAHSWEQGLSHLGHHRQVCLSAPHAGWFLPKSPPTREQAGFQEQEESWSQDQGKRCRGYRGSLGALAQERGPECKGGASWSKEEGCCWGWGSGWGWAGAETPEPPHGGELGRCHWLPCCPQQGDGSTTC